MSKKGDWGGLILLAGLAGIGYLLYKGGVFGGENAFGGGGSEEGAGETPAEDQPIYTPQITIGFAGTTPQLNKIQPYTYASSTPTGYQQKTINLMTTPAMLSSPTIVQARSIIKQTANIDVGQLMGSITTARTYTKIPAPIIQARQARTLIQKTSGINVGNLMTSIKKMR
jgi:hypothetical protein